MEEWRGWGERDRAPIMRGSWDNSFFSPWMMVEVLSTNKKASSTEVLSGWFVKNEWFIWWIENMMRSRWDV